MGEVNKIHAWKQTRKGQIITGLTEGLLAYLFASKAIDSGSWWQYLLAVIFIVGTIQNFVRAVTNHGKN